MVSSADKREGNFVVAASDASGASKKRADYICDGIADDVEIQAALDALPGGGGAVLRDKFQGKEWFSDVQSYWGSRFPPVTKRLLSALQYVALHLDHRNVHSLEFASILRDGGSVFGSVMDALLRGAGVATRRRRRHYDFLDYRGFLREEVPDIHRRSVALRPALPKSVVVPLEELQTEPGIPAWWDAYNKVKHQESKESRKGNLENCVGAVSALALLGGLLGVFPRDDLFVSVNIAHKEGSLDVSDERRLFPRSSISQLPR